MCCSTCQTPRQNFLMVCATCQTPRPKLPNRNEGLGKTLNAMVRGPTQDFKVHADRLGLNFQNFEDCMQTLTDGFKTLVQSKQHTSSNTPPRTNNSWSNSHTQLRVFFRHHGSCHADVSWFLPVGASSSGRPGWLQSGRSEVGWIPAGCCHAQNIS